MKRQCEKVKGGYDAPGGLIRRGMSLADVVLAVRVGVEVHLACRGCSDKGHRGGEEGDREMHCGSRV